MRQVGEGHRRATENEVFHHDTIIDVDVILDLASSAKDRGRPDEYILAEVAAIPYTRPIHDMGVVPNSAPITDVWVDEAIPFILTVYVCTRVREIWLIAHLGHREIGSRIRDPSREDR